MYVSPRIKVTRKIPFISVHLVNQLEERLEPEDILPNIDLNEEEGVVGEGAESHKKSPRKQSANSEVGHDATTQSELVSGLKLDEDGKGSCGKEEVEPREGSGQKRRSGHSSRGAGGSRKSPGEGQSRGQTKGQHKFKTSPKT